MSLLGNAYGPSGTVLFIITASKVPFSFPPQANWSYKIPAGITSVVVEGWGGGGPGAISPSSSHPPGPGGGGGGYFKKTITVTPGQTISGKVGYGGYVNSRSNGGTTTLAGAGCNATGGGFALYGGSGGVAGTASGGDTNTAGTAGSVSNAWSGGGAGNGGGDEIVAAQPPTLPGGGSPGGYTQQFQIFSTIGNGADGQIKISLPLP